MEETQGFYKYDNDSLLYGKNFVLNSNYELRKESYDQHEYPIDGWYWFNSADEAKEHFNVPEEEQQNVDELTPGGLPENIINH